MRTSMPILVVLGILSIGYQGFGQSQAWLGILEEDIPVEARRIKLDSLIKHNKLSTADLADCFHDTGNKLYYRSWLDTRSEPMLDSAIAFTAKAAALKQSMAEPDTTSLKKSYYNLGYFHSLKDSYFEAIEAFSALTDLGGDDPKVYAAYLELGLARMAIGDYHMARACFEKIIEAGNQENGFEMRLLMAHRRMADNYSLMGHREYADLIKFHLDKTDSLYNLMEADDSRHSAQVQMLRGNLAIMMGDYPGATQHHLQVLKLSADYPDDDRAAVFNSLGVSSDRVGDTIRALDFLKRAIQLAPGYTAPYENLGDLYCSREKCAKGIEYYQEAVMLSVYGYSENDFHLPGRADMEIAPDKTSTLSHLIALGNARLKTYGLRGEQNELEMALETFETADILIDMIRAESTEFQTRLYWRDQSANLYMKAVETCFLLGKPEEAFYFMERNKALLLLEDISNEQAKQISGLPPSLAQREFELKRAIFLAENSLKKMGLEAGGSKAGIKQHILDSKRAYERFLDSVAQNYPLYTRLKSRQKIIDYGDFKNRYCTRETAVLQYIMNDSLGFGLVNTRDEVYFFKLADVVGLNEDIRELTSSFAAYTGKRNEQEAFATLSHSVCRQLIPEKAFRLIQGKKLLLIPDYSLQQIPFEALLVDAAGKYLIEETELQYAYSMSFLDANQKIGQVPPNTFMAVAPVDFQDLGLAPLRFSEQEVNDIYELYGGDVLLNGKASKEEFLSMMGQYNILHLSTHADIDQGGNHWVALQDEKLYLNEIYANRTAANMVVLSACNTSRGQISRGEGVMSLARAFFNAGAKSVVSSLWPVPDRAGKDLMVAFYRGLDKGLTKSAALREAKLSLIRDEQNRHPSQWASLILIGDNTPLPSKAFYAKPWNWVLIAVVMLVFLAWFVYYNRKKKRPPVKF